MSKKADSPAAYGDVKFVLDLAITRPGMTYECSSPGRAVYFRQRCGKFRNLMRTMQQEQLFNTPGVRAQTAYDILVIRQFNTDGESDARNGTVLRFDHEALSGILRDAEGNEIEIPTTFHLFDEPSE